MDETQEPIVLGGGLGVSLPPSPFCLVGRDPLPLPSAPRGQRDAGSGAGRMQGPEQRDLPARPRWREGWSVGASRPAPSPARAGRAAGRRAAGSPCGGPSPKAGGGAPGACAGAPSPGSASVPAILGAGAAAGRGGG